MTLIGPVLDDRDFEQLRDELVQRIPTFTPEWTDHNESDPGIALLELFAYLGESLLFRFNQIPDATKVAFLRLLGVQSLPAQPAHVLAALATESPEGVQVLRGGELRAGSVSFETDDEVYAWPLEALGRSRRRCPHPPRTTGGAGRRGDALSRLGLATGAPGSSSSAGAPARSATRRDRRDVADAWIAPCGSRSSMPRRPVTLARDDGRARLFVGVAFDETVERPFLWTPRRRGRRALPVHGARRRTAADAVAAVDRRRSPLTPLAVADDTTRGMTTTGVVELTLPELFPSPTRPATAGRPDSPPPLDDAAQAARVVAWLQVTRPDSAGGARAAATRSTGSAGSGVNAVHATQARATRAGAARHRDRRGRPGLPAGATRRLLPGSVGCEVEEAGALAAVDRGRGLRRRRRTGDRHFTVDLAAGWSVRRRQGPRVPQIGERIRVRSLPVRRRARPATSPPGPSRGHRVGRGHRHQPAAGRGWPGRANRSTRRWTRSRPRCTAATGR